MHTYDKFAAHCYCYTATYPTLYKCPTISLIMCHFDSNYYKYLRVWSTWGMLCQKQVSRARTNNYSPQYLWYVITCPCPWYLLLAQHSSYEYPLLVFDWNKCVNLENHFLQFGDTRTAIETIEHALFLGKTTFCIQSVPIIIQTVCSLLGFVVVWY